MGGICWAIPLTVTITRVPAVLISPDFGTSVFREIIMYRSVAMRKKLCICMIDTIVATPMSSFGAVHK